VTYIKNILISFPYKVNNFDDYEETLNDFENRGYIIHNFEGIEDDFRVDILYSAIQYVKEYEGEDINRIVVISNIKELIFCWFRCYNPLIDDFIYLIDNLEKDFFRNDINYNFYEKLYKFIDIDNEFIEGKIYINLNFYNCNWILPFLFANNNFRYFDTIENFELNKKSKKIAREKIYNYSEKSFRFDIKAELVEGVSVSDDSYLKVLFDGSFFYELRKNTYFIMYFLRAIYREISYELRNKILINFLQSLRYEKKNILSQKIKKYIVKYNIGFEEKMYFLSCLLLLKNKDKFILQNIMESLLNKEDLEYTYEILVNTLCYINNRNVEIYKDYYNDKRKIINKLSTAYLEYYSGKKHKKNIKSEKVKNIAILTDQLLSINHSPTKNMTLDYAINLKKYFTDSKIQIFVEDNLYCEGEVAKIIPCYYSSAISVSLQEEHFSYLMQNGINDIGIYYSDINLPHKEKTARMIEEINKFQPDIIFTNSDISLTRSILYNDYPIVYMCLGETVYSTQADVYLVGDKEKVIEENKMYHFVKSNNVYNVKTALDFSKAYKDITCTDYGLEHSDFVMITVGNRLDADMDNNYIDLICSFISNRHDVKWLIVGEFESHYLERKYKDIFDNQVIRIIYEKDLAALYNICDIYLNPLRRGGGVSIAMAMNQGLPIVISSRPSDGKFYVGEDNCVGYSMDEYTRELEELYVNEEYRLKRQLVMKKRIKMFQMKTAIEDFMEKFIIAKEQFFNRKCNEDF
jgi:hypothetical protein